ncbi:hypothetical protein COOONC_06902 [Cooperia oncophora]
MEATNAMTPGGIISATDYVVSAFTKLTVGQAQQYQTRFGVIRYANTTDLVADLNVYTSTADLFDLNILPLNETGTNIEGAIRLATSKFASSSHRLAARPVLIIVGSSYNEDMLRSGGYNDPTQAASEFREDGGTIITIEYVQEHGLQVPLLRTLASPNYNLTNKKDDGTELRADDLRHLLCEEYVQEHGLQVPLLRTLASPNYNLTNKKDDGTELRADDLRHLLCEGEDY